MNRGRKRGEECLQWDSAGLLRNCGCQVHELAIPVRTLGRLGLHVFLLDEADPSQTFTSLHSFGINAARVERG